MTAARNIIRELQALGARLEGDGERLVLHAGSRAIPQPLVQQARDAKRAILTLLGATIAPSTPAGNRGGLSETPVIKNRLAALAKADLESRRDADDSLRPPFGGLSGGLSSENRGGLSGPRVLAVLDGDQEAKDLRHFSQNNTESNLSVRDGEGVETPKTATPKSVLAVLGNGQDFCGTRDGFSPKTATRSCRKGPAKTATVPNAVEAKSYETCSSATAGSWPSEYLCCECGLPIDERLETWWGGERVHRSCGEAAFQREKESSRQFERHGNHEKLDQYFNA